MTAQMQTQTDPIPVATALRKAPMLARKRTAEFRHPVRWRAVLEAGVEKMAYPGFTLNVASTGCSMVLDHNVGGNHQARIHLQVPPLHRGATPEVITLTVTISQALLSRRGYVVMLRYANPADPGVTRLQQIFNQRYH
jgi:hypothetical protein